MITKKIFCVLFFGYIVRAGITPTTIPPKEKNCGYQSCHPVKEGFINVHLVPHTHDDVGWLKTVDQYYWGNRDDIQKAGVQYILDSVVDALTKDPNRRFIYVETSFFWKWWMQQHDSVKHSVKKLVNNGQLEFIGGGWTMNDEAAAHYQSIVDQLTWGLRKLNDTFGECGRPKIGWQIDPFGHSREMASIFAQLGYDGLLLGRIDYQEKAWRFKSKTAEMVWKGSNNLGDKSNIFTGAMYNRYSAPSGFCFDMLCSDEPIIDAKKSVDYNVDKKVDQFFDHLKNISDAYTTGNIIITMGGDFTYQDAHMYFKNLDKLIYYSNQRQANGSKYNLIYSTPSCYVKAVHDATKGKANWLVKEDDFFPYASDPHAFWTGYFTSRPTSKRFEREGNNFLQVCKQLYALADLDPIDWVDLNALREAMGVMQHHDAIAGTEKEHVAHDYARILQKGFDECQFIAATALSKIIVPSQIKSSEPIPTIPYSSCLLTNTSSCNVSESQDNFVVTIYNPLSRPVNKYVRLPVLGTAYTVTDPEGKRIEVQLIPIADRILNIPGREGKATVELIFIASELPPLGFKSYFVHKTEGNLVVKKENKVKHISNDIAFEIDKSTGLLSNILMNGINLPITQEFLYYNGFVGDNKVFEARASGAYIFRPNGSIPTKVTDVAKVTIYTGPLVSEVHQVFNDWISQIIRIYSLENFIEFDWLVGPIPSKDVNGKEVISRFRTELNSDSTFYTDANGRELQKRILNFRPTWKLNLSEPISGNYYPVSSKILIRDEELGVEVAVLTDRAQGGSSLKDGQIELMVHRNCLHDDAFGVGEALVEEAFGTGLVARGSHYVVVGSYVNSTTGKSIAAQERDIAQRKLLNAWTFLTTTNATDFNSYKAGHKLEFSGLKRALPDNVQILTLEPWKGFSFLLRLEHVLEKDEDSTLSQPVQVNLKDLFTPFEIKSLQETTLGANQFLQNNDRLDFDTGDSIEDVNLDEYGNAVSKLEEEARRQWKRNGSNSQNLVRREIPVVPSQIKNPVEDDNFQIKLTPMQIRTFIIEVEKRTEFN